MDQKSFFRFLTVNVAKERKLSGLKKLGWGTGELQFRTCKKNLRFTATIFCRTVEVFYLNVFTLSAQNVR